MSKKLWVAYEALAKRFGPTRVSIDGCSDVAHFKDEIKKKFEISGPASHFSLYKSDATTEIDVRDSTTLLADGNSSKNPLNVKSVVSSQVSSLQNNFPSKVSMVLRSNITTEEKESILMEFLQSKDREVELALQSKDLEVDLALQSKDLEVDLALQSKDLEVDLALQSKDLEVDLALQSKDQKVDLALQSKDQEVFLALLSKDREVQSKEIHVQSLEQLVQFKDKELQTQDRLLESLERETQGIKAERDFLKGTLHARHIFETYELRFLKGPKLTRTEKWKKHLDLKPNVRRKLEEFDEKVLWHDKAAEIYDELCRSSYRRTIDVGNGKYIVVIDTSLSKTLSWFVKVLANELYGENVSVHKDRFVGPDYETEAPSV